MANPPNSFSKKSLANDDKYSFTEEALLANANLYDDAANILTLDVMSNDSGGAKSLFSIDDGNGSFLQDLLTNNINTGWEETANGNRIRIYNGKIQVDITHSLMAIEGADFGLNALRASDSIHDSFNYAIRLSDGTLSWAKVKIDIHGANDLADITGTASGSVAEDATMTTSGTLNVTDADHGEAYFKSVAPAALRGTYGNFTFNAATGEWDYTLNNGAANVQALAADSVVHDKLTVSSLDGTRQTIDVTINGANDAPVVTRTSLRADGHGHGHAGELSGKIAFTDADAGDEHTASVVLKPLEASAGAPDLAASLANALQTSINEPGRHNNGHSHHKSTLTWDFNLPDGLPHLAAGQTVLASYRIIIADNNGGTATPQDISVLIVGTDGEPQVFTVAAHADLTELADTTGSAALAQASGLLSGDGFDLGEHSSLASALLSSSWSAGGEIPAENAAALASAISLSTVLSDDSHNDDDHHGDDDGAVAWHFNTPDSTFDFLAAGETLTLAYRVTSSESGDEQDSDSHDGDDHEGDSDSEIITITITGTNDAPIITNTTSALVGAVQEDVVATVTGQLSATDVDNGATQTWSVQGSNTGSYGSLAVDSGTGLWTYTLSNEAANVQALAVNEFHDEIFTVRVDDGQGGSVDQTVTVTVSGTNDAPVITNAATALVGAVQEDAVTTVTGQLSATDVDNGATQIWSVQGSNVGAYGSLAVDSGTGLWTYTLNNADANVQALAVDESHDEIFTVRVDDGQGGSVDQTVTVTLSGSNDAPVITNTATALVGAVQEDAVTTVTGQLSATDVDNGATQVWSVQGSNTGSYGSFAVDSATGLWTYTLNNDAANVQALAAGDSHDEIFIVRVDDGRGGSVDQTVTVTVNGTNDMPTLGGVTTNSVTEDATNLDLSTGGQLTIADVDAGQSHFAEQAGVAGAYGTFTLAADGAWTYTANNSQNAIQQLGVNQSITDSFTAVSSDGSASQVVTVTINGTNDAPVITNTATALVGAVQEDAVTTVTGQLSATDIDNGATQAWSVQGSNVGAYGSLAVNSSGLWTYTLNNAAANVQALAAGESRNETFTVRVDDGKGGIADQTVTIAVNGTNDAPILVPVMDFEGLSYANGGITSASNQSGYVWHTDNPGGTIEIHAGTVYGIGTTSQVVELERNAGDPSNLFTNITAAAGETYSVAFDYSPRAGAISSSNISVFWGGSLIGHLSGTSTGLQHFNYTMPAPAAGSYRLEFRADDSNSVGGVLDNIVVQRAAVVTEQVTPADNLSATGSIAFSDKDLSDVHLVSASASGSVLGALTVAVNHDTTGTGTGGQVVWTYTVADSAVEYLAAGETKVERFNVTLNDQHGSLITRQIDVVIVGTNDVPAIGGVSTSSVTEDATNPDLSTGGALTIADADAGQSSFAAQAGVAGAYGTFTLAADGTWTYTANNSQGAIQQLGINQSISDSFTAVSNDGTASQVVTVTINGANDAPVITNTATALVGAVQEDAVTTVTGQLSATDVDNNATQAWSVQGSNTGTYGSLTVDSGTGLWTYTLNNATTNVQALAVGESHDETFIVRVDDGKDGIADQTVTVTVSGTNDIPVITNTVTALTGAVQEDTVTTVTGQLSATDIDNGATQAWSVQGSNVGVYGSFAVDSGSGLWTYTLNNDAANIQALAAGESHNEIFTVRVDDGEGGVVDQTVTVAVNGANDAPVANNDSNALTVTSLANVTHSTFVNWVDWTSAASGSVYGTIDLGNGQTIGVTYTGEYAFTQTNGGTYYYTGPTGLDGTYTGSAVENAPGSSDIIALSRATQKTLTFSEPVNNLFFAVVSLNGNGYLFDQDFQIASDGQGYWGSGYATRNVTADGRYEVVGHGELHGVLQISGTVQSLTWTSETNEYWNGFTVGTYGQAQSATVSGNLLANDSDPDTLDTLVVASVNGSQIVGNSVTLVLASGARVQVNKDGTYLYDENAAFGSLAQDETAYDSFQYTVSDGHGGTSTATVTLAITGTNDAPVITAQDLAGAVTEAETAGGNLNDSGIITFSDVDLADAHLLSATGTPIGSALGSLTAVKNSDTTGTGTGGQLTWTYTVADSAVEYLAAGQTKVESFNITLDDQQGGVITKQIDVTITGTNDVPTIGGVHTGAVTEDEATPNLSTGGTLTIADADAGQSYFAAQTSAAGSYGTFTLAADGAWTYTADNSQSAIQQLAAGQSITDSFTAVSSDGTASQVVTVNINGAEHVPVITSQDLAGSVTVYVPHTNTTLASSYLTAGHNLVNGLGGTSGFGENVLAQADDASSSRIDLTPLFGEAGINFFGRDYTSLFINNNGSVSFNSGVSAWSAGPFPYSTLPQIAPFWADVDTRYTGTMSVSPGGNSTGSNRVWYDLDSANGVLTVTWDDVGTYPSGNNPNAFQLQLINEGSGNFDIVFRYENINWVSGTAGGVAGAGYDAGDNVHYWNMPGSRTTQMLDLENIIGNTGIAGVDVINVRSSPVELTDSGVINFTDDNLSYVHTVSTEGTPIGSVLGSLTAEINHDTTYTGTGGQLTWTYTVDNSLLASLGAGQTKVESFTITLDDQHGGVITQQIDVTINGSDSPTYEWTVSGVHTGAVTEDAATPNLTTGGQLAIADLDAGQSSYFAAQTNVAGAYGIFNLGAGGAWTYTANNSQSAIQQLGAGQSITDSFTAVSNDGSASQLVTVTINGTNDVPTIGGIHTGSVNENATTPNLSTGGTLTIADADAGQSYFTPQTGAAGSYGAFTLTADGAWTYTADNSQSAIQQLVSGQSITDSFTAVSSDGAASQVVTVNINGAEQVPVITSQDVSGSVTVYVPHTNTVLASSYLTAGHNLVNGLGGTSGFGENALAQADDAYSSRIDLKTLFGEAGINFFGRDYTSLFINNNGSVSFNAGVSAYTTSSFPYSSNPQIAPFWADVDTRYTGTMSVSPGGNSTGSNRVWYDLDSANGVLTVTWDDVGTYPSGNNPNAFQLQLINEGSGNFDIVFRYENINWASGSASQGVYAGAGYDAGDNVHYWNMSGSRTTQMLDLENIIGNTGIAGVDVLNIRSDPKLTDSGVINFTEDNLNYVHTVSSTGTPIGSVLGSLTAEINQDTTGTGTGGQLTWIYTVDNSLVASLAVGQTKVESFTITLDDQHGGLITQQIDVTINGAALYSAGVAGEPIQLALTDPSDGHRQSPIAVTVTGLPLGWSLNEGTRLDDNSWAVQTEDLGALTIISPAGFSGAVMLNITETWTNADGTVGSNAVMDNVEVYAPDAPIFAWSGNDSLTGSTGADVFVIGQPIGHDFIYSFDTAADKIDLMDFAGFASFADVQAHLSVAAGDTQLTLAEGQTITLVGIDYTTLTAANFAFN